MKNIINYYYNFDITELRNINNDYVFKNNGKSYLFCRIDDEFNYRDFELLLSEINKFKVFHTVVANRNNMLYTFDGINRYIMFKLNFVGNRYISIDDVVVLQQIIVTSTKLNTNFDWLNLWKHKVDYLEYYMNTKDNINDEIKCIFYYFIGISENSIKYIEHILELRKNSIDKLSICHKRLNTKYTLYDFYNPINIVIDHASRDIAEYLKSMFINKDYNSKKIIDLISKINLSNFGYDLLLGRIAFPTFFFDLIDRQETLQFSESEILGIYDRASEYEQFIFMVFNIIKNTKKINIPSIGWLAKRR